MKPAHLSHRWILKKRTDFGIFPLDTKAFRVPRVSLWLWTGCDFLLPPTNMKVSKCCSGYRFQQEFISTRIQVSSVIINIPGSARWSHCKAIYHWQLHIVSVTGEECRSRRRLQVWMSRQSFTRLSSRTDSGIIFYPHMQTWFTSDLHVSSSYIRLMSVLGWVLRIHEDPKSGEVIQEKQPQHI